MALGSSFQTVNERRLSRLQLLPCRDSDPGLQIQQWLYSLSAWF